jgi:hypothetical protein
MDRQETIHSFQLQNQKVFLSITSSDTIEETKVTTTVAAFHQATFEGTVVDGGVPPNITLGI